MDFGDSPSQSKQIPWKLIALIAGGVVIAIVVIVSVILFIKKPAEKKVSVNTSPIVVEQSKADVPISEQVITCEKADDKDLCNQLAMKQSAATSKDVALCANLDDAQKEDCIWGVANAKQDETLCAGLTDQTSKDSCATAILFKKATSTSNVSLCDKITNESTKEGCQIYILGPITSKNCAAREKDAAYCEMVSFSERAAKAQDPIMCETLKDNLVTECKSRVPIDDPDLDGLSTYDEINLYHTDPRKADTDGDGYSDVAEISSGHDPLKK